MFGICTILNVLFPKLMYETAANNLCFDTQELPDCHLAKQPVYGAYCVEAKSTAYGVLGVTAFRNSLDAVSS